MPISDKNLSDKNPFEEKYFAAANSTCGFINRFKDIFGGIGRLYIIKGGPGTGKSRLMRDIASEAENRGCRVEYYYCSADDTSLDGIIVPSLDLGVIDGTSPHVWEPSLPGVSEEIINLGDFWRSDLLRLRECEIRSLAKRKSALFSGAYSYLAAEGRINSHARSITAEALDIEKMRGAVSRLLRDIHPSDGVECIRYVSAIGMNGRVRFDTHERLAERCYLVSSQWGCAHFFLDEVRRQAKAHGIGAVVSPSPLDPDVIEEIYLPGSRTLFSDHTSSLDENHTFKIINMSRFVSDDALRGSRVKLRFLRKCASSLDEGALSELAEIKRLHFELENIYSYAMDFHAKEEFTKKLLIRIFRGK